MKKITKPSDTVLIDPNEPLILPDGTALVGRIEWFLYALCCLDYQNLPTPMSRIEEFANALITGEIPNIEPQSRAEQFFLAILDGNVSNLPQPQSRSEVLLDKLARGEFDLSDVEPIQSRYELLLAYLIKNGGIDNIDYVLYEFSEAMKTMYNTVEKPFKSLELSGNTLVNCVLEDTENDDYTSFDKDYNGTSFTINGTSEGAIKSAILKGSTKYRDIDTGEVLDAFEDGRNLELVSVKMPVLTTVGKNLLQTQPKLSIGSINPSTGEDLNQYTSESRTSYINVSDLPFPFKFSHGCIGENVRYEANVRWYDASYGFLGNSANPIEQDYFSKIKYARFVLYNPKDTICDIQIEYGVSYTSYEPYKTNILTVNEDVELRGIGDVQDELDLMTGEVVQSVGEIVLDGSDDEEWRLSWGESENYIGFQLTANIPNVKGYSSNQVSNLLPHTEYTALSGKDYEWFVVSHINTFNLKIAKNKLISSNVDGLKRYLSINPLIAQYQLAEKTIKTVDLNVVDQNNIKIDKIHVFDEVTHVNASSDELTPTVNIGKSVSYPTIIKPNTKYTVDLKRNSKPLTVDLGGTEVTFTDGETRKTITTPSTLVNDKLSYYGVGAKCNEIMLIEGEIERNIDYFTGMQSVVMQNQMPILSTVGKNLFDISKCKPNKTINDNGIESNSTLSTYYAYSEFIPISDTFTMSITSDNGTVPNNANGTRLRFYNENKNLVRSEWFSTYVNKESNGRKYAILSMDGAKYLKINFNATGGKADTTYEAMTTIQLEKGSVATPYEPHKSSILSCNDDVTLRGIGDVKDELDLMTGELTQRIGEATFRGAENETWGRFDDSAIQEKTCLFSFYGGLPTFPKEDLKMLSDKYVIKKGYGTLLNTDEEMVHIYADKAVYFRILKSKLSTQNAIGFKEWLSQNPFTVQYQLKTESIKTVDSNVVDQDGNTIPKIKSYDGVTHFEVTVPKQSLLPNVSAEVATDNSKDMSSLTIKHQEISEAQSAIQDNIQSQSDEIDTALMATTEIFESILE